MPPTSTTQSAAKTGSRTERSRSPVRRYDVTHVTAIRVTPNESPNVTGLRQETGPSQGPPSTANTTRWTRPDRTRSSPVV